LLHAAGELARRALGEGCQPRAAGQLRNAPLAFLGVLSEQSAEELQVLEYREGWVKVLAQALGHVGDARADSPTMRGLRHVAVQHLHATLLDASGAGDQRQQT